MTDDELFEIGRQALAAQPFSTLIGAELKVFRQGESVLEIPIRDELLQQNGYVHGGVVSYAADNVLTFVGGSVLGPECLTSEYKINYVKPAVGGRLVARGAVIHAGKRQAVCRCEVVAVDGEGGETLCASAQGTIVATASRD